MAKTKKKSVKKAPAKTKKKTAPVKKAAKKIIKKAAAKPVVKKTAPKKAAKAVVTRKLSRRVDVKRPHGLPEQLRDAALKVLDERKADDVFTVDLIGKSSVADYVIVASGSNSRQLAAIGQYLEDAFEKLGVERVRKEGASEGNWVLIDAGDVIVHLFRPEVRRYYNIESIWEQ